jgi:hypothetical protein
MDPVGILAENWLEIAIKAIELPIWLLRVSSLTFYGYTPDEI